MAPLPWRSVVLAAAVPAALAVGLRGTEGLLSALETRPAAPDGPGEIGGTNGLPYSAFLMTFDAVITAYATWGQSLLMPFDPFYEFPRESSKNRKNLGLKNRDDVMAAVRQWADHKPQTAEHKGVTGPVGLAPGAYFPGSDPALEPTLYNMNAVRARAPGTIVQETPGVFVIHPVQPDLVKAVDHVYVARCKGPCGGVAAWPPSMHENYRSAALTEAYKRVLPNQDNAVSPSATPAPSVVPGIVHLGAQAHPVDHDAEARTAPDEDVSQPLEDIVELTELGAEASEDMLQGSRPASGDDLCVFEAVSGNVRSHGRFGVRAPFGVVIARSHDATPFKFAATVAAEAAAKRARRARRQGLQHADAEAQAQPADGADVAQPAAAQVGPGYDIFIAWRGSRSGGNVAGTALQAKMSRSGNPDWASNLEADRTPTDTLFGGVGRVHTGFQDAARTGLPGIMQCLTTIRRRRGTDASRLFVTGHSLGSALATLTAAALRMGTARRWLPEDLADAFPLDTLKLVTFSSPAVSDAAFRDALERYLAVPQNVGYQPNEPIGPGSYHSVMLHDPARPAWFRVLNRRDVVTAQKDNLLLGGLPVEVDGPRTSHTSKREEIMHQLAYGHVFDAIDELTPQTEPHEPYLVRRNLLNRLGITGDSPVRAFDTMHKRTLEAKSGDVMLAAPTLLQQAYLDFGGEDAGFPQHGPRMRPTQPQAVYRQAAALYSSLLVKPVRGALKGNVEPKRLQGTWRMKPLHRGILFDGFKAPYEFELGCAGKEQGPAAVAIRWYNEEKERTSGTIQAISDQCTPAMCSADDHCTCVLLTHVTKTTAKHESKYDEKIVLLRLQGPAGARDMLVDAKRAMARQCAEFYGPPPPPPPPRQDAPADGGQQRVLQAAE